LVWLAACVPRFALRQKGASNSVARPRITVVAQSVGTREHPPP
jgi:hypothetical protein